MKNLLSEEIERYQKLSFYNPKLTLTENNDIISEAVFNPATSAREVESAIGRDLQAIIKQYKIGGMTVGEVTRLLEKDAKTFEKELQKAFAKDLAEGFPKGQLGPAAKNLSKVDMLRRLSVESKSQGRALNPAEIEALIKEVAAENKLKVANFKPKTPKVPKPKPEEIDEFVKVKDPDKNKWSWQKMLKWGTGLGIGAAALYWIYTKSHGEEPPVPVPPVPVPVPPTPNPSQYRSCPETLPIAKFCKNETIKKVQGCLGITADGLFGPKTQGALESKGVDGTSITQQTVDKVCNNTALVDTDTEDVDGQDPNTI
jgi:hypothetical protein